MVSLAEARRSVASTSGRARVCSVALLLALAAFGLFGVTMGELVGYEPETAAVSEGLVREGQPKIEPSSPLANGGGLRGRAGLEYGRTGLTQPVLEAPFYWIGEKLDDGSGSPASYRWRLTILQLYDPLMAALTVAAIFMLLTLRGVSERRAVLISTLCAVGTLIWPYSKIGMDTTLMALVAATMVLAAWAARRPTVGRSSLLGAGIALTINCKAYGALMLLGVVPLLATPYLRVIRERRAWVLAALASPVLVGVAVAGWYNWYRTGAVTNFGDAYVTARVLSMPFAALGLVVSPGKGLLLYSPLVVLGLLGLRELSRADQPLARAIVVTVVVNIVFIATSIAWGDETWGPRYLVPSAWLLILPIAWWLTNRRRRRWLAGVAVLAVCVQLVGVFAAYGVTVQASRALAGEPVYLYQHLGAQVAYGDDGPRWIPQASPLLFQTELTLAYVKEKLTGSGFTVTYEPWRGNRGRIDLTHPKSEFGPLPDFWWVLPGTTTKQYVLIAVLSMICLGSVLALTIGPFGSRRLHGPV